MYGTVHPLVNRWRGEYRNLPPVDGSSRRERDFWLSKCSRCKSTQVKVNFDSFNFELIESILIFLNFVVRWRWCSQFLKNVVENLSFDPICSNFVGCMETNFGRRGKRFVECDQLEPSSRSNYANQESSAPPI